MKKSNFKKTIITIVLFCITYGTFIISGFIPEKVSDVSNLYSTINLQDIKIEYVRCDTNPDKNIIEIECDIVHNTYSTKMLQSIYAFYNEKKQLDTKILLSKDDNLIFQVSSPKKLPQNQAILVDLYFGTSAETKEPEIAEIVVSIDQARADCNLAPVTEQEYRIRRIDYDISFYTAKINELTEKKEANEKTIEELQTFIASQSTAGKTSKEIEEMNQIITNNQDKIVNLQADNTEIDSDILNYQKLINETDAKRSLYE